MLGFFYSFSFIVLKHPGDQVVSTSDFVSGGPVFKSHWRQNSAHDYGTSLDSAFHSILCLDMTSRYVELYIKHQTIVIIFSEWSNRS